MVVTCPRLLRSIQPPSIPNCDSRKVVLQCGIFHASSMPEDNRDGPGRHGKTVAGLLNDAIFTRNITVTS